MTQQFEFDIAIIGGGMVGTSLASLLAAGLPQLRIALIESQPFSDVSAADYQPSFDARSTALSYGSADILRELGLWEKLQAHITPIQQVHVSDRGHLGGGVIEAADQGLDAVGYVVENSWLGNVLLAHVQQQSNIQCFAPAKVNSLMPLQDGALLHIQASEQVFTIKTALAVIADGGDSPLRRALGIATEVRDYHQTALIANVEFSESHQGVAYERFTADGPMALLPLGESGNAHRSALVWTLPNDQAATIAALSDEDFLAELQDRFGFRVGRFTRVSKRYAYPLQLVIAQEQIRSHIVLVGNAAHFLHPVAGQGFNLALRDCACMVAVLRECDQPLGALPVLQSYRERQALDQQLTIEFSDRLVRLFSNDHLPLMALRHLGFVSLETIPFLKNQFVAQTMGTAGRRFQWRDDEDINTSFTPADSHSSLSQQHITQTVDAGKNAYTDFDVIIVGAGLVGAALACAIAQMSSSANLHIAVIEAGGEPHSYTGENFDPRVVALTHASQQLLTDIGCWDAIVAARVCAYREMKVWDGEGTASIEFDAAEVRQTHLGHIVENSVVVHALRERMTQLPQIQLIQPAAVMELIPADLPDTATQVSLSNGMQLTCSLLIAADGAHSKVRSLANFSTREWDYGQQAIVTTVQTENPHEFTAWQRFMHTGPLAFLPLQHQGDAHRCSIVWSAEDALAQELMALTDEQFCVRLEAAFEARLGKITGCAERIAIPLRQRHASSYIQPGIALVGDAAHNIHPLAGQGVNLGMMDVIVLVQEIERAQERGIPLADYSILRRYQRQRMAANLGMMAAMEGFKQLFGSRSLAVNWLRNTGMRELNSMKTIKKIIINTALGVS
jgi:2-octaprenylphenol hydroxylase